MRYALCNEVLRHLRFDAACQLMAEAGYQGVELAPMCFAPSVEQIDAAMRAAIRHTAHAAGLEIVGLHMLLWGQDDLHVAHPDPAVRRRTADYLVSLVEFAEAVGAPLMVFGSPKQRSTIPPLTPQQALALWLDTLQPALRRCEQLGVLMLLEPLPPFETDVLNTLAEAVAVLDELRHPSLGHTARCEVRPERDGRCACPHPPLCTLSEACPPERSGHACARLRTDRFRPDSASPAGSRL
jgi:D-psicose/D-tagatose/L-ribulose 3-epimerase